MRIGRWGRRKGNTIDDPVEKARFADEIREMFDPVERQKQEQEKLEKLILQSHREPTMEELLEELKRQCERLRPGYSGPLLACCGAYTYAMYMKCRSYPEVAMGVKFRLDNYIPPWDVVVLKEIHRGKQKGGIL